MKTRRWEVALCKQKFAKNEKKRTGLWDAGFTNGEFNYVIAEAEKANENEYRRGVIGT